MSKLMRSLVAFKSNQHQQKNCSRWRKQTSSEMWAWGEPSFQASSRWVSFWGGRAGRRSRWGSSPPAPGRGVMRCSGVSCCRLRGKIQGELSLCRQRATTPTWKVLSGKQVGAHSKLIWGKPSPGKTLVKLTKVLSCSLNLKSEGDGFTFPFCIFSKNTMGWKKNTWIYASDICSPCQATFRGVQTYWPGQAGNGGKTKNIWPYKLLMIKKVAREARKLRMLQREMEKEDTKSSRKRKEAKHNYAAKVQI